MKESTGQEPRKSIKETFVEIIRNYIKKKITGNLGDVYETEDKLICYVDKKRLKKDKYGIKISCQGITEWNEQLATKYNLDKQVIYVVDGFVFKKDRVDIEGTNNCEIVIRNCNFYRGLFLESYDKCTLENVDANISYFIDLKAEELIIKDTIIHRELIGDREPHIRIRTNKKLELNNSNIGDKTSRIYIETENKLYIYNSKITGSAIECYAKKYAVFSKKSLITATRLVELEIPDYGQINIISPVIISNGNVFPTSNNLRILRQANKELTLSRLALIQLLKEMKSKIDTKNEVTLEKCQTSL